MNKGKRISWPLCYTVVYYSLVLFSEVEPLLKMAADNGVDEAKKALKDLYPHRYT